MNRSQILKWAFRILCVIGLTVLLCTDTLIGQTKPKSPIESLNDDNFKKKIAKVFVLIHFTEKYQYANLDPKLLAGVKGHEGCVILVINHEDVKKVVKKLRIRNYPSIAIFHNGSKKEVWKADMDGQVEVTIKDIKSAIEDAMAGDVF